MEDTPLHWAAQNGQTDICLHIMNSITDKNPSNNQGVTPLHLAAHFGSLEICQALILCCNNKNPADENGVTPLHRSAMRGHLDICKAIIVNVCDKNPSDNMGNTPLHSAAEDGYFDIVQLITSNVVLRANVLVNLAGDTPLEIARRHRQWEIARLLQDATESSAKCMTINAANTHKQTDTESNFFM